MYKIVAIGDVVLDTHVKIDDASVECGLDGRACKLCLDYAAKVPVTDSFQTVGGNCANLVFGTSRLGLKSTLLSTIGIDSNGQIIKNEIKKRGIDVKFLTADKKHKTRYAIILNFKGERTILSYHKKRQYSWPTSFPKTEWIYYTSLSEGFEKMQSSLEKYLKKNKEIKLAFNPGSFQMKSKMDQVKKMIPLSNLLFLNLEEAEKITGLKYKDDNIKEIVLNLVNLGAKEVAITDGARGGYTGDGVNLYHMDAYDVKIISKTGAGDSFAAGYLAAKIKGLTIEQCLKWGIADSCSVLGHFGVELGQLDNKGMEKMIKKFKTVQPNRI